MPSPHLSASSILLSLLLLTTTLLPSTSAQQQQDVAADYTSPKKFKQAILNVTNTYRRQHNASDLVWNETLADFAEDWAEGCQFEHSGGPYGENLASGYPNTSASLHAWGHERLSYSFSDGSFSKKTGHFTQLVWRNTTAVGCGVVNCRDDEDDDGRRKMRKRDKAPGFYVVCEYSPAGNVEGQFQDNVLPRVPFSEEPKVDGYEEEDGDDDDNDDGGDGDEEEECPQGAVCNAATGGFAEVRRKVIWAGVGMMGVAVWFGGWC